jgi:hypothetical protein
MKTRVDKPTQCYGVPQVEFAKQDLRFVAEATSKQAFVFATTVSFIDVEAQALSEYTPPNPPVIFSVPYDVFYPFQIYSRASPRLKPVWGGAVWLAVVGVLGVASAWL